MCWNFKRQKDKLEKFESLNEIIQIGIEWKKSVRDAGNIYIYTTIMMTIPYSMVGIILVHTKFADENLFPCTMYKYMHALLSLIS